MHPLIANVYFSVAILTPDSEHPLPLTVGDMSASTNSTCSLTEAVRLKDGSVDDVKVGSKLKTGGVRSMVVKSLATPWLGPQFKLRSDTEFAPSCTATVPSLHPRTVTT